MTKYEIILYWSDADGAFIAEVPDFIITETNPIEFYMASRLAKVRAYAEANADLVTTLGSPWWVDKLVMWQPVKRILKTAILGTCVRGCQFDMLSLYQSEQLTPAKVQAFQQRITAKLQRWQKTQAPAKGYRRCKTWK